jgi:hypothetical protein
MKIRTHFLGLCAGLVACGSQVDLGTPYGPDASSGGASATTGAATTGSGSSTSTTGAGGATTTTTTEGSGGAAPEGFCTRDGVMHPVGTTYPAAPNNCNTCTCEAPGNELCTRCACPPTTTDAGTPRCGTSGTGGGTGSDGAVPGPYPCSMPFDPGPCMGAVPVFAYVDGACVERIYNGCQGNANRFSTVEECWYTCDGRPDPQGCPEGRVRKSICLGCGPAGGCAKSAVVCAEPCEDGGACSTRGFVCYEGVCQAAFCE